MNRLVTLILIAVLSFGSMLAAQEVVKPPNRSFLKEKIQNLLNDLGHDDYERREEAMLKLLARAKACEKGVLDKVKELSKKTKDPEVETRTNFILSKFIDFKEKERRKREQPKLKGAIREKNIIQYLSSGIMSKNVTNILKIHLNIKAGIIITDIDFGSYTSRSGLRKNDIVLSIKKKATTSGYSFEALKLGGGDVVILRKGKRLTLKFKRWEWRQEKCEVEDWSKKITGTGAFKIVSYNIEKALGKITAEKLIKKVKEETGMDYKVNKETKTMLVLAQQEYHDVIKELIKRIEGKK
jgi:hypothetical protein